MGLSWKAAILVLAGGLAATPAQAAGGLWCNADDAAVKLDIQTGVTHGMGGPFFDFTAAAEVRAAGVSDDFRRLVLDKNLVHSWIDGDEAKLSFYLERDRADSVAAIEITVETEADPDDESTYRGSYALSFFEPGTAGADDRRIEVSGPISCGAD